jgi:ribonuclease P protein component
VNDAPKSTSGRFPRSRRLLKRADFQAVYKEGGKRFSGNVTIFYRERQDEAGPRVGFTVGKVLGGAVARRHLNELSGSVDVVMHPRKSVLSLEFTKLDAEIERLFVAIQKGRAR